MVDNTTLLYDMMRDIKEEIECIKEVQVEHKAILSEHMRRTQLAEINIEMLRKQEAECPGREVAKWNKGLFDRLKDAAIIIGMIATLAKLFGWV